MKPYYDEAGITIYHGEALAAIASLPEASCDVLLTDPPYSSGGMFRGDRTKDTRDKYTVPGGGGGSAFRSVDYGSFAGDSRDQRSWSAWVAAWSWASLRVVRPGGHAFMFSDWRQLPAGTDALQLGGWTWRGVVVWDKGQDRGMPIRGFFRSNIEFIACGTNGPISERADVTEFPGALVTAPVRSGGVDKQHPTEKPVQLLRHLLGIVPRDSPTVLDPFMGSGTTLRAAKDLGCKAIGVEISEAYCEIAAKRLAQEVLAL